MLNVPLHVDISASEYCLLVNTSLLFISGLLYIAQITLRCVHPALRVTASSTFVCPEGKFIDAQLSFSSRQNFPMSYLIFF